MSFDNLLNRFCNIEKNTQTQSASGQKVDSWGVIALDCKCRIDPKSGSRIVGPEFIYEKATHILYMRTIPGIDFMTADYRIISEGIEYKILWGEKLDGKISSNHLEILIERAV